jgi:hypothetical protein
VGESHPLHITIKTEFKKMDKKIYFEPKVEVITLKMKSAVLVGSDIDEETGEAPISDTEI